MLKATLLVVLLLAPPDDSPLGTRAPLGVPTAGIVDNRIIGTWVLEGLVEGDHKTYVAVYPFNAAEYLVLVSTTQQRVKPYRAFGVRVEGETFIDLAYVYGTYPPQAHAVFRIKQESQDRVVIKFAKEAPVGAVSIGDTEILAKWVGKHKDDSGAFSNDYVLQRVDWIEDVACPFHVQTGFEEDGGK